MSELEFMVNLTMLPEDKYGTKITKFHLERLIKNALESHDYSVIQVFVEDYAEYDGE